MHTRAVIAAVITALVLGVGPAAAGPTQDTTTRTWGVQPLDAPGATDRAAFTYDLTPGATTVDAVEVTNFGDAPLTVQVYATDAFNTEDGGFDVLPAASTPTDVGSWVSLDQRSVTIPARGTANLPFTLTVPSDAEPGDHAGGIVASVAGAAVDGNGNPITLDQRVGTRIYLRVDGELRPELSVLSIDVAYEGTANPFGTGSATVDYLIRNTGNIRLSAEQSLSVAGPFGLLRQRISLDDVPELLPGSTFEGSVVVDDVWPSIRAKASVTLRPIGTDTGPIDASATSATTWAVPWTLLALIVALAIATWLRRRRASAAAPSGDATPTGDGTAPPPPTADAVSGPTPC